MVKGQKLGTTAYDLFKSVGTPIVYSVTERKKLQNIGKELSAVFKNTKDWYGGKDLLGVDLLQEIDSVEPKYYRKLSKDKIVTVEGKKMLMGFSSESYFDETSVILQATAGFVDYSVPIANIKPDKIRMRIEAAVIDKTLKDTKYCSVYKKYLDSIEELRDDCFENLQILSDNKMLSVLISFQLQYELNFEEFAVFLKYLTRLVLHQPNLDLKYSIEGNDRAKISAMYVYTEPSKNPNTVSKHYKDQFESMENSDFTFVMSKNGATKRAENVANYISKKWKGCKVYKMEFERNSEYDYKKKKYRYFREAIPTCNFVIIKDPINLTLQSETYNREMLDLVQKYNRNVKGNTGLPFGGIGIGTRRFKEHVWNWMRRIIGK
ncbi:MAG: hypothetical protein GWN01_10285 [Nitrosopumilaceae archaeon]|nr:hypothetical protein [Nitrosopumilaceae archaeon]NIU01286.1 hypothetical protein [Nitrosopumilaceae archaeon]NIU87634.1 hypothetical protein [Nitrosopumilaceae archaeon]NIV66059.1 hypothetical protein [Nitrosopumilaceae archaeon]NIX61888.1 hypothetical protein [Nitrosopumilaceae archaeon]